MTTYLLARSDNGQAISLPVGQRVEIGRTEDGWTVVAKTASDVISLEISDATVSKTHALIYRESGKLLLRDLGSRNGTLLNGQHLAGWRPGVQSDPVEIQDNAVIRFGLNTTVRLMVEEKTLRREEWEGAEGT